MKALSKYTLRDLEALLSDLRPVATAPQEQRIDSLLKTIRAVKAPKRGVSHRHQVAKEKVASKRELRDAVYALVDDRAKGACEMCGRSVGVQLEHDHFFGRGKAPETERTVWLLCRICHHQKTNNMPSRAYWCHSYADAHCERYAYFREAERAIREAEFDEAKRAFVTTRSALGGGR